MDVGSRRAVGTVLSLVTLAALAAGASRPSSAEAVGPAPNIVLIMTDDQTYESLRHMANVAELAAAGTTFTNYHANFALCCPSRVTTITGQYVHNHGVWTNHGYPALAPNAGNTLPVWLSQAGYRTMLVGKYINGYGHAVHGVPPGWDVWRPKIHGGGEGIADYYDIFMGDGEETEQHAGYATDTIGQIAIDEVTASPAEQPFFLWLTFNAPHFANLDDPEDPVGVPVKSTSPRTDHRDAFEGVRAPNRGTAAFNERDVSDKPRHIRRMPRMSAEIRSAVDEAYSQQLEALQAVDEWIGRLREALALTGRLDDTLIMFTTDNGYYFGEHRIPSGKRAPYPAASRMPLVVSGPGFAAGVEDHRPRSNVDLAPTILAAAGAQPGLPQDGRALTHDVSDARAILMEGRIPSVRAPVSYGIAQFTAIRTRNWFFARYRYLDGETDSELYDLRRDPTLLTSLPGRSERRVRLRHRMESMAGYSV